MEDGEGFPARKYLPLVISFRLTIFAGFSVGDSYLFMCQISLAPDEDSYEPITAPAEFKIVWKR
jgi:hypothetical protein